MVSRDDLKGVSLLILVSVVSAFAFNQWSSSGIALFGQWDKARGVVSPMGKNTVVDQGREINDLDAMIQLVDRQGCTVVDVRSREIFDQGHLPGAISLPFARFDEVVGEFFEAHPPESCVVLYCAGRECLDSHRFADQLVEFGYVNVRVFSGGFSDWKAEGLKVEKG
ncbi:MAG: rhodanese-like domain-containing protein [Desulfobacteraceae bacterium]|nr:rhodanese-like domain-containing protein [Desulfobacteraceae bacterium]